MSISISVFINPHNDDIMKLNKKNKVALTFDDITLEDKPSLYHPNDVNLDTFVTRNIKIKGCILSAAMDTVTEEKMALAMAKVGGLGIIHRNLDINKQVNMITWVRKQIHYKGMISEPVCFDPCTTIRDVKKEIKNNDYTFTSFPVIDINKKLVGLLACNDMDFCESLDTPIATIMKQRNDVMTCNKDLNIEQVYELMLSKKIKKLPVVDENDILLGLYVWNDICDNQKQKNSFSLDSEGHFLVGGAIGSGNDELLRAKELVKAGCKILVIDTSHGACLAIKTQLINLKKMFTNIDIIVGNVASYESAKYLLDNSEYFPDAIKVGIGPGSICTTRQVTGHGVPQVTAIYEVYKAVKEFEEKTGIYIPIIADGGIRYSGDIVKCFAMGASSVMLGSVLGSTTESPGQLIIKNNKKYKSIRGMGSRSAMNDKYNEGSKLRYFSQTKFVPEGIAGLVEYKGPINKVISELYGGIRAGLSHSGSNNIIDFQKKVTIWTQTNAGIIESNPHNIENIHD